METLGIGTDIVDMSRFMRARFPDRIAEYILIDEEIEAMHKSRNTIQFLASRFAAKEAIIKASPISLTYHNILIQRDGQKLSAHIITLPQAVPYKLFLSVAHEFRYTIAYAIVCR